MQLAALGLDMTSVHAFTLQRIAPVAYPHKLPAPSEFALQAAADDNEYDVQGVAAIQAVPLNAHVAR